MISNIIHHQNHSLGWILIDQQVLQKGDKLRTVLGFGNGPGDGIVGPIAATKHMSLLFDPRSGRWDPLLLPDLHPAGSQRWVECQRGFVHKDELEIVSEDLFFSPSSSSPACA